MDGYWKVYWELNGINQDDTVELCKRFSTEAESALFYLHPIKDSTGKELPHIHGLIYNWSKSDDTFRNQIKKAHNVKGTQLAVSNTYERGTKMNVEHIGKYITYMSKGKFEPLYNKAFDDEMIVKLKSEWKSPTTVRISGDLTVITHGEVNKKAITQYALARELEVWIIEEMANDNTPSHANVIRKARAILHSYRKVADDYMLIKICQDAMWPMSESTRIQKIISRL